MNRLTFVIWATVFLIGTRTGRTQESVDPHERSHYNCAVGCAFIAAVHHKKENASLAACSEWFPLGERAAGDAVSMASLADVLQSQGIPAIPARISDKHITANHLPAILLLSHGVAGAEAGHYVYAIDVNERGITIIDPNNAVDSLFVESSELVTFWDGKLLVLKDSDRRMAIGAFVIFWTVVCFLAWRFIGRSRDDKQVHAPVQLCWLILFLGCEQPDPTPTEAKTDQRSSFNFTYDSDANEHTLSIPVEGLTHLPVVVTNVRTSCQCMAPKTWVGRLIAPGTTVELPIVIDIRNRTEVSGLVTIEFDNGDARTYRLFGAQCYPPRFLERNVVCEYEEGQALPSGHIVLYQSRTAEQSAWIPELSVLKGSIVSLSFERTNSTTRFQGASKAATAVVDTHQWTWQMHSLPESDETTDSLTVTWQGQPLHATSIPFKFKHASAIAGIPDAISIGKLKVGREWKYQFVCRRRGNLPFSVIAAKSSHEDVRMETIKKATGLYLIRISIVANAPEPDFTRSVRLEFLPNNLKPVTVRLNGTAVQEAFVPKQI